MGPLGAQSAAMPFATFVASGIGAVGVVGLGAGRGDVEAPVGEEQHDLARVVVGRGRLRRQRALHAGDRVVEVGVEALIAGAEACELPGDGAGAGLIERLPRAVRVEVVGESGEQHLDLHPAAGQVGEPLHGHLRGRHPLGGRVGARLVTRRVTQASRFVHDEREQQSVMLLEAPAQRGERRRGRRRPGGRDSRRRHDRRRRDQRADRQPEHPGA